MKPFDLQKALAGEPVVTRDGFSVCQLKVFTLNREGKNVCKLCGVVLIPNGNDIIDNWTIDGVWNIGQKQSRNDLFMATKKRTVWVNLYSSGWGRYYKSEDEADEADANILGDKDQRNRIGGKAHAIEIEE